MANKSKISTFTIKVNTDNGKVKIDGVTKSSLRRHVTGVHKAHQVGRNKTIAKAQAEIAT